jgi:thioredoxin reductase (NADPH)
MLRASENLVQELTAEDKVVLHLSTRVQEIKGETQVEAVDVVAEGEEETIELDGLFLYLQGTVPVTDFLDDQVSANEEGCLMVDENFETSIEGVSAVGDVLCKHVKQAAIAAAEGVQAALAVDRYLHGRAKLRPDWSH